MGINQAGREGNGRYVFVLWELWDAAFFLELDLNEELYKSG